VAVILRGALVLLGGVLGGACAPWQQPAVAPGKACVEAADGLHSSQELAAMARVIEAGLRTAMLAGNGLTVRDFIENLERTDAGVEVSLFTAAGEPVYAPKGPPPARSSLPPHVRQVIERGKASDPEASVTAFPLANEQACQACHPAGPLRGVLSFSYQPPTRTGDQALFPLARMVEAAFDAMMTAGKASDVDRYLQALPSEVPGIAAAAVFSRDGRATLGDGLFEVPPEVARRALTPIQPFAVDAPDGRLVAVPLPSRPRCLTCHKPSDMRGAIILKFTPPFPREATQALITASLRHVMLTGLGRLAKKFLDHSGRTGLFGHLTLHDPEGRLFHDMHARPTPPPFVVEAVRTLRGGVTTAQDGKSALFFTAVRNDDKCRRCHDEEGPVRAVVAIQNARRRSPASLGAAGTQERSSLASQNQR
jgi:hypothetical protein